MSRRGPLHYLIDAHNVLHQDVMLARHMHEPETARSLLEELLANQSHMHVFYDGGPGGEQRAHRRQGLHIDYSGNDEADNRIIRWLQQHAEHRAIVISDDNDLCRRARSLGATTASAHGFLHHFRTAQHHTEAQRGPLNPTEVDEWMRIFGLNENPDTQSGPSSPTH